MKRFKVGMMVVALLWGVGVARAWDRRETDFYGCTPEEGVKGNTKMCAPGDQVTGGGGLCPGDPGNLNRTIPIVVNGVRGWKVVCLDSVTHLPVPTVKTFACCVHTQCFPGDAKTCDLPR